jgi:hypothetical protein
VVRVLKKYGLDGYCDNYVRTATFPSKLQWKNIIHTSVKLKVGRDLQVEYENPKLKRFSEVYGNVMHVHIIWQLQNTITGNKAFLRDFAKLNGVLNSSACNNICIYCSNQFIDLLDHYIHDCKKYESTRELFWSLVVNNFRVRLSAYLYNLDDCEMTAVILGKPIDSFISQSEQRELLILCARCWQILAYERELPFY